MARLRRGDLHLTIIHLLVHLADDRTCIWDNATPVHKVRSLCPHRSTCERRTAIRASSSSATRRHRSGALKQIATSYHYKRNHHAPGPAHPCLSSYTKRSQRHPPPYEEEEGDARAPFSGRRPDSVSRAALKFNQGVAPIGVVTCVIAPSRRGPNASCARESCARESLFLAACTSSPSSTNANNKRETSSSTTKRREQQHS